MKTFLLVVTSLYISWVYLKKMFSKGKSLLRLLVKVYKMNPSPLVFIMVCGFLTPCLSWIRIGSITWVGHGSFQNLGWIHDLLLFASSFFSSLQPQTRLKVPNKDFRLRIWEGMRPTLAWNPFARVICKTISGEGVIFFNFSFSSLKGIS